MVETVTRIRLDLRNAFSVADVRSTGVVKRLDRNSASMNPVTKACPLG
jgi:hypothetical protein